MVIRYITAILILGISGFYAGELRTSRDFIEQIPELSGLPREIGSWYSEDIPTDGEAARILAADASLHRIYHRSDGSQVGIFLAYFAKQQVNAQIHSPRNCVPGGGWTVDSIEPEQLSLPSGSQLATRMKTHRGDQSEDILYWFSTQGGDVAGEYGLKWDLVKNSLARRPTNAVFIRFNAARSDSAALIEVISLLNDPITQVFADVGLK